MNRIDDVWEIITDFHEGTLRKVVRGMSTMTPVQWKLMNRSAAKRARETEGQLNKLKLTPEDREHYSLIRKMFAEFIKCFEANAEGDSKKALEAMAKADNARIEYMKRRNIGP